MGLLSRRRKETGATTPEGPVPSDLLRSSGLVDEDWYRAAYPDLAATGLDPVEHYLASGAAEGRNPNAFFDSAWYWEANPDVREAGLNPLVHYWTSGAAEGRSAGPRFDTAYYIAQNPEVGAESINPLLHYLQFGQFEGRTAVPYDDAEAFEVGVRAKQLAMTGPASALFRGARGDHVHFPLLARAEPGEAGALPLPPLRLAQRIGSVTLGDFEESGKAIRDTIVRALPEGFTWAGSRCLDFGSGVGRALRHFRAEAQQAEFWGCDIDGSSIRWSVQNLSPPFRFFQISEVPTIPFESNSFDLVYAISVLSHIHSTWHQWLMEIRRILRPGGTFFVSFMGQVPMEEMLGEPYWTRGDDFGMYVKGPHQNWNDGGPMIFVSPEWLRRFWGSIFDIDYIAMEGLMGYQSFCVMRKPEVGVPIRTEVPVLRYGSQQPFDPDATGRILAQVHESEPFQKSYGLDLAPLRNVVVEGWVVFRDDVAAALEVLVDGSPLAASAFFEPGQTHRDWNAPQCAFAATVDLSALRPGTHQLQVRLRSRGGRSHLLSIPLLIR